MDKVTAVITEGSRKEGQETEKSSFTLLVATVNWPPETFIWSMVRTAVASGIRVQVMVSLSPGQDIPGFSDMQLIALPSWNAPLFNRLGNFVRLIALKLLRHPKSLYRLISLLLRAEEKTWREQLILLFRLLPFVGLKPDVLHFQWNATAIECLPLFDFFRCPVVVSCRGSQINIAPHNPRRSTILEGLRKTFEKATAVHCVSEAIKKQAIQFGLEESKAWIIRPAVDADFFEVKKRVDALKAEPFRIVTTGSLLWVKGYEYALLAVRRLLNSGVSVQFEIIGSGSERQRVVYTVHDLGLQEHVRLCGQLLPEEVHDRLRQADAFVLSSLSEGISNAALEAMACGLPVITTDCGGMREAIRDGVEGLVVPIRDVEAMAMALRRIAVDKELRSSLGNAARQRIVNEFSLRKQGLQFLQLYSSILQPSVPQRVPTN